MYPHLSRKFQKPENLIQKSEKFLKHFNKLQTFCVTNLLSFKEKNENSIQLYFHSWTRIDKPELYCISILPDRFSIRFGKNHFYWKPHFVTCRPETISVSTKTEHYVFSLALTSMNRLWDQRNHRELSISGMERISFRSGAFQLLSDTIIKMNNEKVYFKEKLERYDSYPV